MPEQPTSGDVEWAEVGAIIRTRRKFLRLSQDELAERAGTTQPQLSKWEKGREGIGVGNLKALADALECSVDYLLLRTVDPRPPDADAALALARIRAIVDEAYGAGVMPRDQLTRGIGTNGA